LFDAQGFLTLKTSKGLLTVVENNTNDDEDDDEYADDEDDDEDYEEEELPQPPYTHVFFGRLYDEVVIEPPDWYKDEDKWGFVIGQWFRGAPVEAYWARLGM